MTTRVLPKADRRYFGICNHGGCCSNSDETTGYCKKHSSEKYALREKLFQRVSWWLIWVIVLPPAAIAATAEIWKLAIWVVLS